MKILQISFSDLNSLTGHWQIDLEHPAYANDGLFAITGPTGAGKTTILDAICLALYGATPRLGPIGAGGNDLMSRQSGSCHAQVVFETGAGRFVSHWGQHRARMKPDGRLQPARHEVSTLSGEILSSSVRESAAQIITLTGMSFDQFRKSMLLAQGDFSAFLDAKDYERAPILEQITGTEIYSQISITVHAHRSELRSHLMALEAELEGTLVLEDAQIQLIQEETNTLLEQQSKRATEIQAIQVKIERLREFEAVQVRIGQTREEQNKWQQRVDSFASGKLQLQAARRALNVAPVYRALVSAREEQRQDLKNLERVTAQSREIERVLPGLMAQTNQAYKQLGESQQALADLQPRIEQAKSFDTQIGHARSQVQEARQAVTELQRRDIALSQALETSTKSQTDLSGHLSALEHRAQVQAPDAALVQDLSALTQQLQQLTQDDELIAGLKVRAAGLEGKHSDSQRQMQGIESDLKGLQIRYAQDQNQAQKVRQQLLSLLEGQSVNDWHRRNREQLEHKMQLQTCLQMYEEIGAIHKRIQENRQNLAQTQAQLAQTGQQLVLKEEALRLARETLELRQEKWAFEQKVQRYDQARAQLRDGEPCPLCGALAHPYVTHDLPLSDALSEQLDAAKRALKQHEEEVLAQRLLLVGQQQEAAQYDRVLKADVQHLEQQRAVFDQEIRRCGVTADVRFEDLKDVLQETHQKVVLAEAASADLIQKAQTVSEELQAAEQVVQLQVQAITKNESALEQIKLELRGFSEQHKLVQQDLSAQQSRADERRAHLLEALAAYDIQASMLADAQALRAALERRRTAWLQLQDALSEARQKGVALEQTIVHQKTGHADNQTAMERATEKLDALSREHGRLVQSRQDVLSDSDPQQLQDRLQQAIEAARSAHDRAQSQHQQAQIRLEKVQELLTDLHAREQKRQSQLQELQESFTQQLQQMAFVGEQQFIEAQLSHEDMEALEQQSQDLDQVQARLRAALEGLLERHAELKTLTANEAPLANLLEDLVALEKARNDDGERIGALRQRLRDDQAARQAYAQKLQGLQAQRKEYERWDQLHTLIGSADGQKYRRFAQGLTFEMVIRHANVQLAQMTDRYVLRQSSSEALALDVVDLYQAAEVRTTKNLSGGERFLVSLALALGLSRMASRKVRVDSLFLDEGFGTLDEDALETALQALSGLRQEGKMVGVISHVQALKERIGAQIQVRPIRGGISVLEGPGCSRVEQLSS